MIHSVLAVADHIGLVPHAKAHCDIPCGIYDPGPALIAALSVVRLMDLLNDAKTDHARMRNTMRKEEEAEKVKHEIRVIWGDYFKGELLEKHPHVHSLAHSIMLKGSACKQDTHREDGLALVDLVNEFAALFWETKGVKTARGKSPYAPNLEVVYPVL